MVRTQIQLPDPLYRRLKEIAAERDWSLAELMRRAAEAYARTIPPPVAGGGWEMPVLRGSGGHLRDPDAVRAEADVLETRTAGKR